MPALDRVGQLLADREADYQGYLQIARNDVLLKEQLLNELKDTLKINQGDKAEEAINKMISDTRRARRDMVSEGSYLFEDDLANYALGIRGQDPIVRNINNTEGRERKASQPIKGTQAHHPGSVSSTESLVQNMDEYETRRLWEIAKENGYTVGSHRDGFISLSEPAHTTGGKNWGSDFAHVGADGRTPDTGRFKTDSLPKGTTAEQAWPTLQRILDEQRVLNERAFNHPTETLMRQRAEQTLGRPIEWRGPVTPDRAATNALSIQQGVNATTISKAYDRYPGLKDTGLVPNVDVAVPVGVRPPMGTKPDPETALAARQFVRNTPPAQTAKAAAGVAPPKASLGIRGARGALAALPFVPAVLGIAEASMAAGRGDLKEAGGVLAETAVGEVPIVGDAVQSAPVADGTLTAAQRRASQPKPRDNLLIRGINAVDRFITNPGNEIRHGWNQLTGGNRPQPTQQLRIPKQQDLKPEQWSSYKAGGGDAALRKGLTIQQVIEQGRKNR